MKRILIMFISLYLISLGNSQSEKSGDEKQKEKKSGEIEKNSKKDPYKTRITKLVAMAIQIGKAPVKKPIIIGLFGDDVPKTVENFYQMCVSTDLTYKGLKLSYLYSVFHRIVPYSVIQGGDITRGNGEGGWSIYGPVFDDENFGISHDAGVLSTANYGPNTNNSQFFISTEKNTSLNDKYVVFGVVIQNMDVVYLMESYGDKDHTPKEVISIIDCYDPTLVK